MPADLVMILSEFGAAGLIGVLWILERRYAAVRNRQLDEMHRQILAERRDSDALLDVVRDNTRAIVALESSQHQLIDLIRALASETDRHPCPRPGDGRTDRLSGRDSAPSERAKESAA